MDSKGIGLLKNVKTLLLLRIGKSRHVHIQDVIEGLGERGSFHG